MLGDPNIRSIFNGITLQGFRQMVGSINRSASFSRPGELEYDRALAAAKKLDAAIVEIVAAELEERPEAKPSRRKHDSARADRRRYAPRS
jgi:hypothetical protein